MTQPLEVSCINTGCQRTSGCVEPHVPCSATNVGEEVYTRPAVQARVAWGAPGCALAAVAVRAMTPAHAAMALSSTRRRPENLAEQTLVGLVVVFMTTPLVRSGGSGCRAECAGPPKRRR